MMLIYTDVKKCPNIITRSLINKKKTKNIHFYLNIQFCKNSNLNIVNK